MTYFLNSRLCAALTLCIAFASATATAATAEAPRETLAFPTATPPASSAATPPPSIDTAPISAPSPDELGLIQEQNGGLTYTVWQSSTMTTAAPLLAWVKSGVAYEPVRTLVISLLISQAKAPEGSSNGEWLLLRAEALVALGAEDKAAQLLSAVPPALATPRIKQLQAELLLLKEDTVAVCAMGAAEINKAVEVVDPLWQKLNILCKAQAGRRDEASLALELYRELHATDDTFLQEVLHAFADKQYQVKSIPSPLELFDFAALQLAGQTDRLKDRVETLPPVTLKYLLNQPKLDPKLREKVESRAIITGMLPPNPSAKSPPLAFANSLASDITTLVNALGSGNAPSQAESTVIARLALDNSTATQDTRRTLRLLSFMEIFGYEVPANIWEELFKRKGRFDGEIPPALLFDKLAAAQQAGRRAEVVMLSALILESADVEKLHEAVLLPVIKALNTAGFTKEARSLAYDAVQSYRAP